MATLEGCRRRSSGGHGGRALAREQARGRSERGDGKAREEARAARLSLQEGVGARQGHTTRQESSAMVATSTDMRRTLRPFTEDVAGDGMADVGSRFGLLPG